MAGAVVSRDATWSMRVRRWPAVRMRYIAWTMPLSFPTVSDAADRVHMSIKQTKEGVGSESDTYAVVSCGWAAVGDLMPVQWSREVGWI